MLNVDTSQIEKFKKNEKYGGLVAGDSKVAVREW